MTENRKEKKEPHISPPNNIKPQQLLRLIAEQLQIPYAHKRGAALSLSSKIHHFVLRCF